MAEDDARYRSHPRSCPEEFHGTGQQLRNLDPRDRRRLLAAGLVRPVATVALCGVGYFVLPWTSVDGISTVMLLVGGLLVVLAVAVWQIRQILRSDETTVQAIETLALILPVYLLGYAVGYSLMSQSSPTYFSEPLSRMDALYFSLTVFSTVGFGDITATTDPSRAVVSVQIIGNLILIGVGIRVVAAAVILAPWTEVTNGADVSNSSTLCASSSRPSPMTFPSPGCLRDELDRRKPCVSA